MTVKKLIEQLQELDPTLKVLVAQDPEGNSYHAFADYSTGYAVPEGHGYEYRHQEDYTDEGEQYPGDNCVVLWP